MTHDPELIQTLRRLLPILEQGVDRGLYGEGDEASAGVDLVILSQILAAEPPLLVPPEGVAPKDTVIVLGQRPDGSCVVLGTAAISPQSKLRDLAREQFGSAAEDDISEEGEAVYLCEQVLSKVLKEKPTKAVGIAQARELVTRKYGDFRDDDGSMAADAFYICETLLTWTAMAHPDTFAPA